MADKIFDRLERFKRHEFHYPDKLSELLLHLLDVMVVEETKFIPDLVFVVHSDYRQDDPKEHGKGRAIDGHFEVKGNPLPLLDQFVMATRYVWSGIGLYPYWNRPGIHVDVKPLSLDSRRRLWWQDKDGVYKGIEGYLRKQHE